MNNKVIVITGGATGMGLAIGKQLMENNTVISIDRNLSKIEKLKEGFPKIVSIRADITSSLELTDAMKTIEQLYEKIDVLISNAGTGGGFDFLNTSEEELMKNIETQLSINYKAPVMLIKKALPLLKKSLEPTIAVTTTGLVYMPMAVIGSYCASKSAAHIIIMSLRHQLKREGIKVVEVLPPSVDTDLNFAQNVTKMSPEEFTKSFLKKLSNGNSVINVGQSASLEIFSRFFPKLAFRLLNRVQS